MRKTNNLQVYTEEIKVPIKSLLYVKFSNFEVLDKTINDLFNDFKAINFQTNFLKKLVHLYQEVSSYGRTLFNSKAQLTVDLSKLEENFLKKVAFFQSKVETSTEPTRAPRISRQANILSQEDKNDRYYHILENFANNFHTMSITKTQSDDNYLFLSTRTKNQLRIFLILYNAKFSKNIITSGDKLTLLCRVKKLFQYANEQRLGFQSRNRDNRAKFRNNELSLLYSRPRANSDISMKVSNNPIIPSTLCHSEAEIIAITDSIQRMQNANNDRTVTLMPDLDSSEKVSEMFSSITQATPALPTLAPVKKLTKFESQTSHSTHSSLHSVILPTKTISNWNERSPKSRVTRSPTGDSEFENKVDLDAIKSISENSLIPTILSNIYESAEQHYLAHRVMALEAFLKECKRILDEIQSGQIDIDANWAISMSNVHDDEYYDIQNVFGKLVSKYSKKVQFSKFEPFSMCDKHKRCVKLDQNEIFLNEDTNEKCSNPLELIQTHSKPIYYCKHTEPDYCRFSKTSNIACRYKISEFDPNIHILGGKIYFKSQNGKIVIEDFFMSDSELETLILSYFPAKTQLLNIVESSDWKVYSFFSHIFFVLFLLLRFSLFIGKKLRKRLQAYAINRNRIKQDRQLEQEQRLLRAVENRQEMLRMPDIPRLN